MGGRVTDPGPAPPAITDRDVARGLGTTLLARLGALVEVIAQPIYVLMFGLAGYGLYAVLWAAVNLAENIFDLGMTSALQRVIPQAKDGAAEAAALRTALFWGVGPCLLVAALAAAFAEPLAGLVNVAVADEDRVAPAIRLFAWALPLWAFVEIATSALRAKQLFGPEIRLRIFWEQIIRLLLAGSLWLAGWGIIGLFIAHMASLLITALLTMRLVARHYALRHIIVRTWPQEAVANDRRTARDTVLAGLSVLPANIVARLFGDAPPLILNALIPGAGGASAAALFVIIRKVSSIVQLVRTAFAYVLAPVASLAVKHDLAQVSRIYGFATRLAASVALPLALTMAGASAVLMAAFDAETNLPAVIALMFMLVARGVEAMIGAATPVLQVVGRYRHQHWGSTAGLIVAAALATLLVPAAPLVGIVQAVAAGLLIAAIIPAAQLHRSGITIAPIMLARAAFVGSSLGLAGFLLMLWLSESLRWPLALALMLVLAPALMWLALRTLPFDDRAALGSVGRALRLV